MEQGESSASLGEIQLDLWKAVDIGLPAAPTFVSMPGQKVHEKSKKALAHRVKYVVAGPDSRNVPRANMLQRLGEEQVATGRLFSTKYLEKTPAATFVFRYRNFGMCKKCAREVIDVLTML